MSQQGIHDQQSEGSHPRIPHVFQGNIDEYIELEAIFQVDAIQKVLDPRGRKGTIRIMIMESLKRDSRQEPAESVDSRQGKNRRSAGPTVFRRRAEDESKNDIRADNLNYRHFHLHRFPGGGAHRRGDRSEGQRAFQSRDERRESEDDHHDHVRADAHVPVRFLEQERGREEPGEVSRAASREGPGSDDAEPFR